MSTFSKHVLQLVSGSVLAQALGFLLTPIITRIYFPGDFGILQLFLSISNIIVAFSSLSYDRAILLPQEDDDSATLLVLSIILISIISLISGGILVAFSEEIGVLLNTPQISQYLIIVPIAAWVTGIFAVGNVWLSRRKRFGRIATAQVVNTVITRVSQLGIGLISAVAFGLIFGWLLGSCAALVVVLTLLRGDIPLFRTVTIQSLKNMAIRYKKFPIFTCWANFANTISTQIAPIFLVYFFNSTVVGYFSLANMVVLLPIGLIGTATARVFFPKACEEKNRSGSIKNIVREVQQRLISFAMFPMFILMIIGPELFSVILGPQWVSSGLYAGILAPWLLLVFIASPLGSIFSVLERQGIDLGFNILILISRIIVLIIGGLSGDPVVALILYSSTGVIFWGGMNLYLLKISGVSYRVGLSQYIRFFLIGLIIAVPLIAVKLASLSTLVILAVGGLASITYYAIIINYDPLLKREFVGVLRRLPYGNRNTSGK